MRRTITPEQYRAVRLKLDLTQVALAEIMAVNVATINRRENGKETITRETSMALEGFYKLETGSFSLPPVARPKDTSEAGSIAHRQKSFPFSAPRRGSKAPSSTKV
jgi:transcriptional regulator with XRE-family HTH domain|tara:strand:- start:879 stop:1196 length:318 start_codon:yes stop_codon:yes gene_type:complete